MRNIKYILIMALMLMNGANADPFTPPDNDITIKIISQIFGGLMPNGGVDAFGSAMQTFCSACLIIAGILATYTLLAGTIGTAHDGEMLGKKFSSVWIPIRYTLGTALVLPVVGSGYAIVQKLVMWVIIQGIGLGGMVWGSYMEKPYSQATTTVQETTKYDIQNLAERIFLNQVCVKSNAYGVKHSDSILDLIHKYNYEMSFDGDANTYNFGDTNGTLLGAGENACGSVKLADKVSNTTIANQSSVSNSGKLGALDELFIPADISPINTAQKTATVSMINELGAVADTFITEDNIDNAKAKSYYAKINTAKDNYVKTIESVAKSTASNQADVSSKAKQYGWAIAGAYYMNIVVTNNKIATAIGSIPVATNKMHSRFENSTAIQMKATKVLSTGNPNFTGISKASNENANDVDMSWDAKLVNTVVKFFTKIDFYNLKNDTRHPIIILSDMGNSLTDAYTHTLMAVLGISIAGGLVAGVLGTISPIGAVITGSIGNAILSLLGFLALPLMALIATAFTASYIIPMMPFLMWLGVLAGYFIAVIIAIIAAPLWAIIHLHPNGDDLTGKGGSGYTILMGLMLRPALSVFGLIASLIVSDVMGEFINKVFFQVFSYSQGDGNGIMSFMKVVMGCTIYVSAMFIFIKKCFSLMHIIPDEMMKWVDPKGQGDAGKYAGQMAGTGAKATSQVAGYMAGKGSLDIAKGAGGKIKENIDKFGKAMQDKENANQQAMKDSENKLKAEEEKDKNNWKSFNNHNQKVNGATGGNSNAINDIFGITPDNVNSLSSLKAMNAFNTGSSIVKKFGDDNAIEDYTSRLKNASADKFASEGGVENACVNIALGVAKDSLIEKANGVGGNDFANEVKEKARNQDGSFNLQMANRMIKNFKPEPESFDDTAKVFDHSLNKAGDENPLNDLDMFEKPNDEIKNISDEKPNE